MKEQIRKIEIGNEIVDAIIGVFIFRINKDGKREVLLVQHKVTGKWYFPGGKVKQGEKMQVTIKRELKEELGIDYDGKFSELTAGSYEIGGKKLGIVNITAVDPLYSEPSIQKADAIQNFVWTTSPEDYDLTEQARKTVELKMSGEKEIPRAEKIRNARVE